VGISKVKSQKLKWYRITWPESTIQKLKVKSQNNNLAADSQIIVVNASVDSVKTSRTSVAKIAADSQITRPPPPIQNLKFIIQNSTGFILGAAVYNVYLNCCLVKRLPD